MPVRALGEEPVTGASTNAWRYDDFAVSRGGQANLPFFRAFTVDHIVGPDNGPASRELADDVRRDLLTRQPYRDIVVFVDVLQALRIVNHGFPSRDGLTITGPRQA